MSYYPEVDYIKKYRALSLLDRWMYVNSDSGITINIRCRHYIIPIRLGTSMALHVVYMVVDDVVKRQPRASLCV